MAMNRRDILRNGALIGLVAPVAGCGWTSPSARMPVHPGDTPRHGGTLRVGVIETLQSGNLDAHKPIGRGAIRGWALYAKLWEWAEDGSPVLALAEEAEIAPDASSWTIRLKPGLEFHHGKTITADDAIFSIRRLTDPALGSPYAALQASVDRDAIEKLDNRTFRLHAKDGQGLVPLAETWTSFGGIVPTDYHPVTNPVGAGPYKLDLFTPGRLSRYTRFANYFKPRQPFADTLEIIEFRDQITRLAALLAGQVDVVDRIPPEYARALKNDARARVITSPSNNWQAFNLNLALPPFDDPRVREAFRLMIDRPDMIRRVLHGEGRVANDFYAPQDTSFDASFPQRAYDPARARALLREAGKEGLRVELVTDGAGEASALVFSEQAKSAGVTIDVRKVDSATFNGPDRNNWAITTGEMPARGFLATALHVDAPVAANNRTNFHDKEFAALFDQASAEPDVAKRRPLVRQMQQMQRDRGGLIIWGFSNVLNVGAPYVGGINAEQTQFAAWRFDQIWLNGHADDVARATPRTTTSHKAS